MAANGTKKTPQEVYKMGLDALRKRDYPRAVKVFDTLIAKRVMLEQSLMNMGSALAGMGNFAGAMKAFEKVITINPMAEKAWYNLANALARLSKYPEAIKCFRRAVGINGRNQKTWFGLGVILGRMGNHDGAMNCYDNVVCIKEDKELNFTIGEVLNASGDEGPDPDFIEEDFGKPLPTVNMDGSAPAHDLSELLEVNEHTCAADPAAETGIYDRLSQSLECTETVKGILYHAHQKFKDQLLVESQELFEKALELDKGCIEAREGLGKVYAAMGDHHNAMDQYKKVVEMRMGKSV